jgi:phosphate transport system substrate-binding protein
MAKKYGRCANYGECTLADSHNTIESTEENFICTECGKPLRVVANAIEEENKFKKIFSKIRKWLLPLGLILLGIIAWIGFGSNGDTPPPPPTKITTPTPSQVKASEDNIILRIHGSNTIGAKLAPALVEAFMKEKGYTQIEKVPLRELEVLIRGKKEGSRTFDAVEIKAHGSSTAFDETDENKKVGLIGGYADVGMSSSPIKEEAIQKFEAQKLGNPTSRTQEHVIALDGLAIILNPNNPIEKLNVEDVKKIFLGEITDWSQIGGKAGQIKLYSRDKQSGTYDTFKHLVLSGQKLECDVNNPNLKCFEDSKELSSHVASDLNGIGFIGLNYIGTTKALKISMGSGVNAISPSRFSIKTEDYPLGRRLFLYQINQPTPLASEFIQFVLSNDGQKVVSDNGLVEVSAMIEATVEAIYEIENDKKRILTDTAIPNAYKDLIRNSDRKDTQLNFRFNSGTSDLDNKAFRDIGRLAEKLSKSEFQGSKLILIGFTDAKGDATQNLQLSIQRANKVKEELMVEGIEVDTVTGFGEEPSLLIDPREDNNDSLGKNRRVEVWLKR